MVEARLAKMADHQINLFHTAPVNIFTGAVCTAPVIIFTGAASDHDLVMMTFQVRLKMARKPNQPRLRCDLEKLRSPDVACTFQATIGGKFAPLIGLSDEDMDMDTMITTYNTAMTDAASAILGKERRRKSHGSPKMFSTSVMRGEI